MNRQEASRRRQEATEAQQMDFERERLLVSKNMVKYGGSFVEHLGKALKRADLQNTQKIKNTFSEYWNKYKNM